MAGFGTSIFLEQPNPCRGAEQQRLSDFSIALLPTTPAGSAFNAALLRNTTDATQSAILE